MTKARIKDIAQVAIFVRGVDKSLGFTEELASVVPLKGTTKDSDILEAVMATLNRVQLNLNKMSGVTTDGAPSMCGSRQGLVKLLQNEESKARNNSVMQFHCVIHQENLFAKSLKMDNVMSIVTKAVNFIRFKGLRHRQFQNLILARKQILKIYHTTAKYVGLAVAKCWSDFLSLMTVYNYLRQIKVTLFLKLIMRSGYAPRLSC